LKTEWLFEDRLNNTDYSGKEKKMSRLTSNSFRILLLSLFIFAIQLTGCGEDDVRVNLLSPPDGTVFVGSTEITFSWEVRKLEGGFTSVICFDKGTDPYDGNVEYCETVGPNVTTYTSFFSAGWWGEWTEWGVIVNNEYTGQIFKFRVDRAL
jgi:hypothetical protein